MIKDDIVKRFVTVPSYLETGAGKLAGLWGCTREEIYEARDQARILLHSKETQELQDVISEQEDIITQYVGSEATEEGIIKKFQSKKPLTPKEVEELAGVDGINTYVARVWDKLLPSGTWTYSIDIRYRIKDFYTTEGLKEKLALLMPDIKPVKLPVVPAGVDNPALIICIADDHCGAVNTSNLFTKNPQTYKERLLELVSEHEDVKFDEVHIISLGDQLNGWNSQTTRGGHRVESLSNEEQFDLYLEARIAFYNALFMSEMSENYYVHDVENSNHSGLGMSYMANRALGIYLDARFPQVARKSITDTLGGFEYGDHFIMFGHGKDEKLQRRPMPYNLDAKTDLYLYDYAQNKGHSPYDKNITFYKGDLHQHGLQHGKFGRYINVPSIAGNSDYGDINFGNTKGGALLEIIGKDSYRVLSQAIWF